MALYSLADFIVNLENQYDFLIKQCIGYRYDGTAPADFTIQVTGEELRREQSITPGYPLFRRISGKRMCVPAAVYGASYA